MTGFVVQDHIYSWINITVLSKMVGLILNNITLLFKAFIWPLLFSELHINSIFVQLQTEIKFMKKLK